MNRFGWRKVTWIVWIINLENSFCNLIAARKQVKVIHHQYPSVAFHALKAMKAKTTPFGLKNNYHYRHQIGFPSSCGFSIFNKIAEEPFFRKSQISQLSHVMKWPQIAQMTQIILIRIAASGRFRRLPYAGYICVIHRESAKCTDVAQPKSV